MYHTENNCIQVYEPDCLFLRFCVSETKRPIRKRKTLVYKQHSEPRTKQKNIINVTPTSKQFNFNNLPNDIQLEILKNLPISTIINLTNTTKQNTNLLTKDPIFINKINKETIIIKEKNKIDYLEKSLEMLLNTNDEWGKYNLFLEKSWNITSPKNWRLFKMSHNSIEKENFDRELIRDEEYNNLLLKRHGYKNLTNYDKITLLNDAIMYHEDYNNSVISDDNILN